MVMVHISIGGLTANTAANAFALPVGYRPSTPIFNKVCANTVGQTADCIIRSTDGVVRISSTSTLCLGFVMFMAEQ